MFGRGLFVLIDVGGLGLAFVLSRPEGLTLEAPRSEPGPADLKLFSSDGQTGLAERTDQSVHVRRAKDAAGDQGARDKSPASPKTTAAIRW